MAADRPHAVGAGWRSELRDLASVMVFKQPSSDAEAPGAVPLPAVIREHLPNEAVDYEGFVVARLPLGEAEALADLAWSMGLRARIAESWEIAGLARRFELDDVAGRLGRWGDLGVAARTVPGLFWVQFAFPVRAEWQRALEACGAELVVDVPHRAVLARAASASVLSHCFPVAAVLAAVEPVWTTDRADPEVFDGGRVTVNLLPGVDPETAGLDSVLEVVEIDVGHNSFEAVDLPAVQLLFEHPLVLSLEPVRNSEASPSDERQSLQVARQWNPLTGDPLGAAGSYLTWLAGRGLGNDSNLGVVAFFETGIDNQSTSLSHNDLAGRLLERYQIALHPAGEVTHAPDETGHGQVVATSAVGSGLSGSTQGGYRRGIGVSPYAKFHVIDRWHWTTSTCSQIQQAVETRIPGANRWLVTRTQPATIANHSWNDNTMTLYWSHLGPMFDESAWDADLQATGRQPILSVITAGNQGRDPDGEVATRYPGNAKNVISVGAVDSWTSGTPSCPQSPSVNPPNSPDPFDGPFVVGDFSSYGDDSDGVSPLAPDPFPAVGSPFPRIKPDLVAPGWRVEGARPSPLLCPSHSSVCSANGAQFSWGRGTSFAAPVVTGAASLLTKRFRDMGVEPKPTLLKAAMIATADSLGPVIDGEVFCYDPGDPKHEGDCRPSLKYGWGLLNLDRLTATTPARWFLNEDVELVGVGSFWPTTQQLFRPADPKLPILIALVWNDLPSAGTPSANWALKRDLDLTVLEHNIPVFWSGNSLRENVLGIDDGWSQPFGFWNGSIPDSVNNVEVVFIPKGAYAYPSAPALELRVDDVAHASPDHVRYPGQPFSIYAWNLQCVAGCG